jgi:hypothetical protein
MDLFKNASRRLVALRLLTMTTVALMVVGCDRGQTDLSTIGIVPFRDLAGVHLGMRWSDLLEIRPAATVAPYVGLTERAGGWLLFYSFSEKHLSEAPIDPADGRTRAKLDAMSADSAASDAAVARQLFTDVIKRLRASHGTPESCSVFATEVSSGREAAWEVGTLRLSAMLVRTDSVRGTPVGVPESHAVRITVRPAKSLPLGTNRRQVDCADVVSFTASPARD